MSRGVAEQLVAQARAKGIDLVGPDGLLTRLTKPRSTDEPGLCRCGG